MTEKLDVAIVGAGPYGLSIAAHLAAAGVNARVFGKPMEMWRDHMLGDMKLKSYGYATDLSAPGVGYTLRDHSVAHNVPYEHTSANVQLQEFVNYGLAFQKKFVANLNEADVASLKRSGDIYELTTTDGASFTARNVVLCVGVLHFGRQVAPFVGLPASAVTHTMDHVDMGRFKGQDVTVVGAGSSAIEAAEGLLRAGAHTRVLVRGDKINFWGKPGKRSLWYRLVHPDTGLGPGWSAVLLSRLPGGFRFLSLQSRVNLVRSYLGPRPSFHLKAPVEAQAEIVLRTKVEKARIENGKVVLDVRGPSGPATISTDHVVVGSGFDPNVKRLPFVDESLKSAIDEFEGLPLLDHYFQSSVPGLYFAGNLATLAFGPLMRFVLGTSFAAPRVAGSIVRRLRSA